MSVVLGRGRKPTVIKQMTEPISDVTSTEDRDITECLNNDFVSLGHYFDPQFNLTSTCQ